MYYYYCFNIYMFSYVVRQAMICFIIMCAVSGTRQAIDGIFYAHDVTQEGGRSVVRGSGLTCVRMW